MAKIPDLTLNRILMENAALVEAPTIRPPREKTGSTDFGNVEQVKRDFKETKEQMGGKTIETYKAPASAVRYRTLRPGLYAGSGRRNGCGAGTHMLQFN